MPRRRRRPAAKHTQLLNQHRHLYDEMLEAQGGRCAICPRPPSERRRLDIDHDHKAMYIRGLLCVRCNRALASWITSAWLRAAADYLDRGEHPAVSREKTASSSDPSTAKGG
jgi:hypothetical protein